MWLEPEYSFAPFQTGNVDSGDIPPEVPLWHENGRTPTDTRSHRSRQEQRARVAPDAARRIMQHHLGRNSQHPQHSQHHAPRQHMHFSNHAPPVPPNAVSYHWEVLKANTLT